MRITSRFLGLIMFVSSIFAGLLTCVQLLRAQTTGVSVSADMVIQHDVPMKTRDGVILYADIYRPKSSEKFPVILMRTPYDKSVNWAVSPAYKMVARGYVVIIQDVRGRYTSEGEWYPFRHEQADGYDAVEWAASLPYSNGKVGMIGASYVGATQMLAAIGAPPHLAGIAPAVTGSNYHDNWTYQGGAFEQWFDQNWTTQLAHNTLDRLIEKNTDARVGAPTLPLADYPIFNFGQLPVDAQLTTSIAPYYGDWLAHPDYDDYWKQWSIEEHFSSITVPMLQVGGWYDIFSAGTLGNYVGVKAHGATEAARTQQHLLMQIGGHAGFGRRIGDVDFGPHALENPYTDVILDWYDYLFKGIRNQFSTDKPVKIFAMGVNEYRQEDDWPRRKPTTRNIFFTPRAKLIHCAAMVLFPPRSRSRNSRIHTFMIPEILFLRSVVLFAVRRNSWNPARAINGRWKTATMYWCTRLGP